MPLVIPKSEMKLFQISFYELSFPLYSPTIFTKSSELKLDIALPSSESWGILLSAMSRTCIFLNFSRRMGYISDFLSFSSICRVALRQNCAYGTRNRNHNLQSSSRCLISFNHKWWCVEWTALAQLHIPSTRNIPSNDYSLFLYILYSL